MSQPTVRLAKTLSLPSAVALALGICVGAGLLVLTGLAYQQSGGSAVYVWAIDGLLVMPVLAVLAYLGARYPNAEGVAGIIRLAFGGNAAIAVQALLIGTFALGLPGISIVGGNYFAFLVQGGPLVGVIAAAAILVFSGVSNYLGARLSGNIQKGFTFSLLAIVLVVAIVALSQNDYSNGSGIAPISEWHEAVPSLKIVFIAFSGWILVASTVEEYINARRDYPLAVLISFVIVLALYLLIALATQLTLSRHDPDLTTAPVAAILGALLGQASGKVVALVGFLIVTANLNGATWAFSRLLMASARNGLLPSRLARISQTNEVPSAAIFAAIALFLTVLGFYSLHVVSLNTLFWFAGQNFFILYLLCVLSFIRLFDKLWLRLPAICLAVAYVVWSADYRLSLLYPLTLMCGGLLVLYLKGNAFKADGRLGRPRDVTSALAFGEGKPLQRIDQETDAR